MFLIECLAMILYLREADIREILSLAELVKPLNWPDDNTKVERQASKSIENVLCDHSLLQKNLLTSTVLTT